MAMTNRPAGEITWVLLDETGSKAPFSLNFAANALIADVRAAAAALRPLIAAITSCVIVSESITYGAFDPAVAAAASGSRVENKGTFIFSTLVATLARYSVPGISAGTLTVEGRIDEDDANVAAFITAVTGGIWTDSRGADLIQLVRAYQKFRNTTRRMLPAKREPDIDTTDDSNPEPE